MPASTPYPLRLSPDLRREIIRTSAAVNLTFPEVMRQAILFGLPVLEKRLGKKTPRP